MSNDDLRIEIPVHIRQRQQVHQSGETDVAPPLDEAVPRIARLLTLAHKWEGLVRRGEVKNCAGIARVAGLTKVRVTQILSLTLLAPDIQERLLSGAVAGGRPIAEHRLRDFTTEPLWIPQRLSCHRASRRRDLLFH